MADIVSERYALSLYEVAAEGDKQKQFLDELTAVWKVFAHEPDFLKMLLTPSIAADDKHKVLRAAFEGRIETYLLNFLMLITEKGRVGLIHSMREAYKEHYYFENGIVEVRAITAKPLSAALAEKLKAKMSAVTGKQVVLETSVDESILGGIVVKLGGEQFDTSLRTRLNEIAARLTNTIA